MALLSGWLFLGFCLDFGLIWLSFTKILVGVGLIWPDFGWIWFGLGWIWLDFGLDCCTLAHFY